jgi:hypothetical protein
MGQASCVASLFDSPIGDYLEKEMVVKMSKKLKEPKANFKKGNDSTNLNYRDTRPTQCVNQLSLYFLESKKNYIVLDL